MRRARPDDAGVVSEVAQAAKAHWGYDEEFLAAVRDELTYTADDVVRRHIVVAEADGAVIGFYSLDGEPPAGELGNLWVRPDHIGTGLGRLLFEHAMTTAAAAGHEHLDVDSDPYAEGFYLRMGAERIGESPSGSIPGRMVPKLRVRTA
ncbi:GNAT family N-acetyltransferase [Lentzea sp. NPDC051213]|uniref:GNAT family N-acetyltransferase n=1 Tax=Lentzea sp. NPDC051213 TaxID=3364126 RepID=UPI0037A04DD5